LIKGIVYYRLKTTTLWPFLQDNLYEPVLETIKQFNQHHQQCALVSGHSHVGRTRNDQMHLRAVD